MGGGTPPHPFQNAKSFCLPHWEIHHPLEGWWIPIPSPMHARQPTCARNVFHQLARTRNVKRASNVGTRNAVAANVQNLCSHLTRTTFRKLYKQLHRLRAINVSLRSAPAAEGCQQNSRKRKNHVTEKAHVIHADTASLQQYSDLQHLRRHEDLASLQPLVTLIAMHLWNCEN